MKIIKRVFGALALMVCASFFITNNVGAVDIDSASALNSAFAGKAAMVIDRTVTLTGNVELDAGPLQFIDGDYILNLDGHTLKVNEFYVSGGSLTINDATNKGVIDTPIMQVEENGILTVNRMILNSSFIYTDPSGAGHKMPAQLMLAPGSTTVLHSAVVEQNIWNEGGKLTIHYAEAQGINANLDSELTIYDGKFESLFVVNLESARTAKISLYGGTFTGTEDGAILIEAADNVDANTIQDIVADGYKATFSSYRLANTYHDEHTNKTYTTGAWGDQVSIIEDHSTELLNQVAPDGIWAVNSVKPKNETDANFLLNALAGDLATPEGYQFMAYGSSDLETGTLMLTYNGQTVAEKTVKVVYHEPSIATQTKVDAILNKIAAHTNNIQTPETGFRLEDLYLINFLNASTQGMDYSLALNFAKDLIKLTHGGNISYKYDARLGAGSPGIWGYTGGQVTVYYNGGVVNTTKIGLTNVNVIYVPNETADTDSARIAAALQRIKDYLGTTEGITIELGGTLASLGNWNEYNFIDATTAGANYYNVKINGKTYQFVICKKAAIQLETPEYLASDILSNISIKSGSAKLPLDTALTVVPIVNDSIKKALNTDLYAAYDISLYSNAQQISITELKDDEFIVSIPVPEALQDKELTVYYINSKGEKEEHVAIVKDGVATFETNHFSTYVLAERSTTTVPNTFDSLGVSLLTGLVALVGLVGVTAYSIIIRSRQTY